VRRNTLSAILVTLGVVATIAQEPKPAFQVASIRENVSGQNNWSYSRGLTPNLFGEFTRVPGQISINNAPLRDIIARAYAILPEHDRFILRGGPDDILSKRFDIRAIPPPGASPDQTPDMLKALLQERFNLKIRRETVTAPVYALVVLREGRLGSGLKPAELGCRAFLKLREADPELVEPLASDGRPLCDGVGINQPVKGAWTLAYTSDMDFLVARIQAFLDRPVINATALSGNFEWRVTWSGVRGIDAPAPPLPRALEDQLGLRLDQRDGPLEVLVIESVQQPTEN
jgi:uncharacterized protein (TIGR03435 family)